MGIPGSRAYGFRFKVSGLGFRALRVSGLWGRFKEFGFRFWAWESVHVSPSLLYVG